MNNTEEEEDTEIERELLFRQSKLIFPEVEDWILNIAVDAYFKNKGEKIEITEEAQKIKEGFFEGLEYKTPTEV